MHLLHVLNETFLSFYFCSFQFSSGIPKLTANFHFFMIFVFGYELSEPIISG